MTEMPTTYPLLDQLTGPEDVRDLDASQLEALSGDVRAFLLESVQKTGGHLGSNLGVVELTVALHHVYNFKRDRIIFDVSHQSYPHKLLTGRREGFKNLRRTGGMCGFTNPHESEYDLFHTGHAGTSISLGLGMAVAAGREEDPPHVVSLIGDAALGAGVAFEALNHAGALGARMLVILNDNEWSISQSVGALSRYLTRIRSMRFVQRAGHETKKLLHAVPVIGPKLDKTLDDLGEVMRHMVVPGHVFEELGVHYVGPVDGHDVGRLVETLQRVRSLEGVVVLHVLTEKGKGHPDGPMHPERVHAVKPRKLEVPAPAGETLAPKGVSFTQAFSDALMGIAERDMRVHAVTAAMVGGTGLTAYAERFPSRFHDTGITEQHAIGFCAGLAKAGLRPVAAIYSTFLQRGYDQVFQEVALQNLPVVLALDRAGPVGQDGATHNGVFDLAYLRTLPNMVLGSPRDATDTRRMLESLVAADGPGALRFPRANCPAVETLPEPERRTMRPGKAEVLLDGEPGGVVIWALGHLVADALAAADALAVDGISVAVVDPRFVKPLDEELLASHLRGYRFLITMEAHQRMGGFGSAVLELAARLPENKSLARVRVLGLPDRFLDHATTPEEQLTALGLDSAGLQKQVRSLLGGSRVL